jgi:transposase
MKKNNTSPKSSKRKEIGRKTRSKTRKESFTIGMDLGDKTSHYCVIDCDGERVRESTVATTKKGMQQRFGCLPRCRIAIEVGTHSPWVSRLLSSLGHEVIVANARQVKLISTSTKKSDRLDAQTLARLARLDPELLRPIRHRSEKAQGDLMQVRVRAALVDTRTGLVNTARGMAKAMGERLPACDADQMGVEKMQGLPAMLVEALRPLLETVEVLTKQIKASDQKLEQLAGSDYPETELLRQVSGVGSLISLTFVLTVEDPSRFQKSRDVGSYVGLRPRRSESGESRPQLGISKEGDVYLRKLLVQGAHCILSHKSPDTDLKRWGLKLAGKGNKNAKKRALVAVARKLAILLHHLWVNGEVYEPLRNSKPLEPKAAA